MANRRFTKFVSFVLTLFLSGIFVAFAGSLTPSAPPGSTMNSLSDIYNSIAGNFDSSAIVLAPLLPVI